MRYSAVLRFAVLCYSVVRYDLPCRVVSWCSTMNPHLVKARYRYLPGFFIIFFQIRHCFARRKRKKTSSTLNRAASVTGGKLNELSSYIILFISFAYFPCLSFCFPVCLSSCLPVCLSVFLPPWLYMSVCLSVTLSSCTNVPSHAILFRAISKPVLFSLQVKDVIPPAVEYLPIGTRVCAHWSPQYRCFYPGSVIESKWILLFTKLCSDIIHSL